MSKIDKPDILPALPVLPEMLANAMPPMIPQLTYKDGIVKGFFHNIKIGQISKSKSREADIAVSNERGVNATLGMTKSILVYSSDVSLALAENHHRQRMLQIEEQKAAAELQILQLEAHENHLELKAKTKEFESGFAEAEAGND